VKFSQAILFFMPMDCGFCLSLPVYSIPTKGGFPEGMLIKRTVNMESSGRLKFIVALTEHRYLGIIILPYLVEPLTAYYSVKYIVRSEELDRIDHTFSSEEKEIIRLTGNYSDSRLTSKFSRSKNSSEFFSQMSPEYLTSTVLPYVSKQLYSIALMLMKQTVPLFEKEPKYANLYEEDIVRVSPHFANARFQFTRTPEGTTYQLTVYLENEQVPLRNRKSKIVAGNPCVLQVRDKLMVFKNLDARKVLPFLDREVIFVPSAVEPKYYTNFVLNMIRDHAVEATGFCVLQSASAPQCVLSFEHNINSRPVLIPKFIYGEREILLNDTREVLVRMESDGTSYTFHKFIRDRKWENELVRFLKKSGLTEDAGGYLLPVSTLMEQKSAIYAMIGWIAQHDEVLNRRNIEIRQTFFEQTYHFGKPDLEFDLRQRKDWFDLYVVVRLGDYSFPFIKLRKYILNGIREFELPDGTWAVLPEEWFEQYRQLLQSGRQEGDRLVFDPHFFHLLKNKIPGQIPGVIAAFQQKLQTSEQIAVPDGLKADLRAYQVTGFRWMYALISNGLGGCLADDMGLGKTLQTLALLLSYKKVISDLLPFQAEATPGQLSLFEPVDPIEPVQPASLIIVPTSLVHNWLNEIRKFAPSLRVYVHAGLQRRKSNAFGDMVRRCDAVITTYGTLRNDRLLFERYRFFITILDESQYIKNKSSKTFEAVMALKSDHHMVLTGTPVENSLADLWAQMNFLNRGLLGSYSFFRQYYQTPIETHSDEQAGERLQLLIRPFVLRRKKDEVATDLPPLVESVMYCAMTPEQQVIYEREKSQIRNAIMAGIEHNGIGGSSLIILRGLTRLRQLANHPSMVQEEDEAGSGKFNEIFMALSGLISENHKVLIFSSFVSHLELLRKQIQDEGWKYSLLTGKTRNREAVIKEFQEDPDIKIFLISLKAGGVGLNLTRADYVFILDPWWNPASENQAISRAHRIGQDKHVFVYRFITENSIEDKIEQLKERKSILAEKFINANDPFKAISQDEIISLFE
jgi:hypothetical protein